MDVEYTYLLKINIAFILFYAFYRLFFYKDTFFKWRRGLLLLFYVIALIYPVIQIQHWIVQQQSIVEIATIYATMLPEVEILAEPTAKDWGTLFVDSLWIIYSIGLFIYMSRFAIQLVSIARLRLKSQLSEINGQQVYLLPQVASPFSFFKMIFIHPQSHSVEETSEIMAHESTHARQMHTVDVLISEMVTIICWFNPFVWLLKREVRYNLEYLADQNVITAGFDTKRYQYHLLGLAQHSSNIYLYNSFNMLHLKNRILMMNKKRSTRIGIAKYMMFIPLSAAIMLGSNFDAVASVSDLLVVDDVVNNVVVEDNEKVKIKGKVVDLNNKPIVGASVVLKGVNTGTITDIDGNFALEIPNNSTIVASYVGYNTAAVSIINSQTETSSGTDKDKKTHFTTIKLVKNTDEKVFVIVDKMPQFPGGNGAMNKFLSRTIKYPVEASKKKIQGRVICQFVVTKDGTITDLIVLRKVDPLLDAEAIRVINLMPKWIPGEHGGKAVRTKFTLPILFRVKSELKAPATTPSKDSEDQVFVVVEKMPQFPGGTAAQNKFLSQNIKYPTAAFENGIQGRVVCQFVVSKDGTITNLKVLRGVDPSLDAEAIRVINSMPKWVPGKQKGVAVNAKFTLPVLFRLRGEAKAPAAK